MTAFQVDELSDTDLPFTDETNTVLDMFTTFRLKEERKWCEILNSQVWKNGRDRVNFDEAKGWNLRKLLKRW